MISKAILIKAQLDLRKYRRKLDDPMDHQKKLLFYILKQNKDTTFGLDHNFANIRTIKDYQEQVPLGDFSQKYPYFKQAYEQEGILTKDPVVHWIQTTGTLGTPKYLPITQEGVKRFSEGTSRQLFSYLLDKPGNEEILKGKVFGYIGQSRIGELNGLPIGYASGVAVERLTNPIVTKRVVPGLEITNIADWKERLWQTMLTVAAEDVRFVSGIAPVLLGFLDIMRTTIPMRLNEIKDPKLRVKVQNAIFGDVIDFEMLWPNMQLLASTGVAVESYKPLIRELLGANISITEWYSASEGYFAFQMHEDDSDLYLNFDNYFFEFLDLDDPSKVFLLDEVEEDVPYEVIITNTHGLYRYNMHDVVKFSSVDPPKILVQGRTSSILNLGGEKVSEDQLALVISQAMKTLDKTSIDYILSGAVALPLRHKIYIELAKQTKNATKDASQISDIYDELMKQVNSTYDLARGQSLIQPEIHFLKEGAFQAISERKAEKSGQLAHSKVLHIVQPKDLEKYIEEDMIEYSHVPEEE